MKILFLLFIFYTIFIVHGAFDKNLAGPIDMFVQGIEKCTGFEKDEYNFTMKFRKFNRTTLALDANITMTSPIDRTNKLLAVIDQYNNNAWKENFMVKEFDDLCQIFTDYLPELTNQLYKIPGTKKCYLPKGQYKSTNFPLKFDMPSYAVFFYNKYRIKASILSKSNRRKICALIFVDFVPKRNRKG